MAYKYRIKKKIDKSCSPEKVRYYAVPVTKGKIRLKEIAEEIAYSSALTPGDVYSTIISLAHFMERELCHGNQICLEPIGTFYLSASSKGFDSPDECRGEDVKVKRICFKSSRDLKATLQDTIEFKKERK